MPSNRGTSHPRSINTCKECKRRKVRCDQRRPTCSRCASIEGLTCVYETVVGSRTYQFVPQSSSSSAAVSTPAEAVVPISPERLRNLENRLDNLTEMVQSLRSDRSLVVPSVEDDLEDQHSQMSMRKRSRHASPGDWQNFEEGYLDAQGPGKTRYASRTFWACLCNEADEIGFLLRSQNRSENPVFENPRWRNRSVTGLLTSPPSGHLSHTLSGTRDEVDESLNKFPERELCNELVDAFIRNYHSIVPLIHVPSFLTEYERFWETGVRDRLLSQSSPLVLAILFAGTVVCSNAVFQRSLSHQNRQDVARQFQWRCSEALRKAQFPRIPTVETLTAYMILQGTWMKEEEPLSTNAFVGIIVRVAQMLGLNRDPSFFKALLSPIAAEVRRRVWWHVFHLDTLVSLASGLPPLIDRGSWDVREVSELRDEAIGTSEGLKYDEDVRKGLRDAAKCDQPGCLVSSHGIFLGGKMETSFTARRLLNQTFRTSRMSQEQILECEKDLEQLATRLSARIERFPARAMATTTEETFNIWAKILLSVLSSQYWWILGTCLLNEKNQHDVGYLYPRIVHNSREFVQKFIWLSASEAFVGFQWAWPGNHQPLHSLVILLKEIERHPHDEAAISICSLIDQTIGLCAPGGGVSGMVEESINSHPLEEGGREAWDLVSRLRSKIWIQAGLNPDNILTRQQIIIEAEQQLQTFIDSMKTQSLIDTNLQVTGDPANYSDYFTGLGDQSTVDLNWEDWDRLFSDVY